MQEELNSNQFAGVTGKKEYFFTNRDVGLCKNTHIFKGVKDKVSIESKKLLFNIIFNSSVTKNTRRI